MNRPPIAPQLVRGGLVLVHPRSGQPLQVIALQYNPDSITRSLQAKAMPEAQSTDHSTALRLRGPAVETIRVEAELDATDQLEAPGENDTVAREGLAPALSRIERLVNPTVAQLLATDRLASQGTLEIVPMETPLVVFVWSANRVVPVRITELGITEEAFDTRLNPIRAKVTLGLRVLTVDDLGFDHPGGVLHIAAMRTRERLAAQAPPASLSTLGLTRL